MASMLVSIDSVWLMQYCILFQQMKTHYYLLFREDILHRQSKYYFSGKVSISFLKKWFLCSYESEHEKYQSVEEQSL